MIKFIIFDLDGVLVEAKEIHYEALNEALGEKFWHEEDTLTLTSHNHLWVYPGKQPIRNSIAVMPEIHNDDVFQCLGICSDYIKNYKNDGK
jgi:phosphoglycolate phosphatase-like HAD superfamily hydrolase